VAACASGQAGRTSRYLVPSRHYTSRGPGRVPAGGTLSGSLRHTTYEYRVKIAIISRECLRQRAGDRATLERQLAALEAERNEQRRTITWSFTAYDARTKLRRLYPVPQS